MPNHCENTLTVTGSKAEIKRFKDHAHNNDTSNVLDTEAFIPYPQAFKDVDKADEGHSSKSFNLKAEDKELLVGMNGYDWNCKNWGTKWGIYEADLSSDTDKELVYHFTTAWSPCVPVVDKMAMMFPKLEFEYYYGESGCDFEGNIEYKNGEQTSFEESKYRHFCEECDLKDEEVEYIEEKEQHLCEKCNRTPLQNLVKETIEGFEK